MGPASLETDRLGDGADCNTYDPQVIKTEFRKAPVTAFGFFGELRAAFGVKFLFMIFAAGHCSIGAKTSLIDSAAPWLFRAAHVPAATMEIYSSVMNLPSACSFVLGMLSDWLPIGGYHKMPYFVFTSALAMISLTLASFREQLNLPIGFLVLFLSISRTHSSWCDLLMNAQMTVKMLDEPERGKNLVPFYTGGMILAGCVMGILYGPLVSLSPAGPRTALWFCIFLACLPLVPAIMNFQGEEKTSPKQVEEFRRKIKATKTLPLLGAGVCTAGILNAFSAMIVTNPLHRVIINICLLASVLIAGNAVLRPELARLITFLSISSFVNIQQGSAIFYFLTDDALIYPDGPHLGPLFVNTTVAAFGFFSSLFALALYSRYLVGMRYKNQFDCMFIAIVLSKVPAMLMATRVLTHFLSGFSSDKVLVLVFDLMGKCSTVWSYTIITAIMQKSCPTGLEASIFAILATFASMGTECSMLVGSFILNSFKFNPSGESGDADMFRRFPQVIIFNLCITFIMYPLLRRLLPDATLDEPLLKGDTDSAIAGSWLSRWLAGRVLVKGKSEAMA